MPPASPIWTRTSPLPSSDTPSKLIIITFVAAGIEPKVGVAPEAVVSELNVNPAVGNVSKAG